MAGIVRVGEGAADPQRAHALGAQQPLLAGHRVGVDAELVERDRDRPGRLRAVDDRRRRPAARASAPSARDRQDRTGRPQHVARDDGPGRPLERAAERRRACSSSSPPSPMSTNSTSTPSRSRSARSGPRTPGCSWLVVTHAVAGRPRQRVERRGSCRRSSSGSARCRPDPRRGRAATDGARLRHPVQEREELVDRRAARRRARCAACSSIARMGLGRQRAARARR